MKAPEVSLLLPAYDAEATLPAALASIACQSLRDFECIVVDDGSTDATFAIARARAQADPRFRAMRCQHRGVVAALQAGLAECRGRFVARMDADDVMHRERLALQRAALAPELAAVGCHVRLFPRSKLTDGRRAYEAWLNSLATPEHLFRDRFVECPLAHPTLFARREVLERHGYRDAGWPEDYDLVLRLYAAGEALGVVPRRLLFWRDGPARLSRTSPVYAQARFVQCKAHFLASTWLGSSRDYVLWGYGDTGRALCKALAGLERRPTHIVELHPGRIGQRVQGALVIEPEALRRLDPKPSRIVVSVAGARPRGEIRDKLAELGFAEERDFVVAA